MKLVPVFFLVLALVACGGDGRSSAKGDVAVVGGLHLKQALFNDLMGQAEASYKAQGHAWPKSGTAGYQAIKSQAVTLLVQSAERQQKAAALGIKITDRQIAAKLKALKKQYFAGNEKKYEAQLKTQGLTDALVRFDVKSQLIQAALFAKLTKNVTVTPSQITAYYAANLSTYRKPESRDVRHILVRSKALANSIFAQVKAGTDKTWCTLAKKYSEDPSSKDKCGKLTVTKGETVPVFDKVAFSQPTGKVHPPVYDSTQYKAYFIIEPLSPIRPPFTTPEKKVATAIKATLLTTAKNNTMTAWTNAVTKDYCSGSWIVYSAGFEPSPDPCAALTATNVTTTN